MVDGSSQDSQGMSFPNSLKGTLLQKSQETFNVLNKHGVSKNNSINGVLIKTRMEVPFLKTNYFVLPLARVQHDIVRQEDKTYP